MDKTAKIAELNDQFRTSFQGGQVLFTPGITAIPPGDLASIIGLIRGFTDFKPDNDPYHEHDFGSVRQDIYHVFWKIDYYDLTMEFGSEDPADPKVTKRVMTIMLAEEY